MWRLSIEVKNTVQQQTKGSFTLAIRRQNTIGYTQLPVIK